MAERRPDPTDRRAKLVAITDAGEAGLDVANATRERLLKQIFGALSEADRATFLRLLDGLDEAAQRLISASATDVAGGLGMTAGSRPTITSSASHTFSPGVQLVMSSVTPVAGSQRSAEKDHRWLILVIVAVAQLMVVLDATVVNIALPSAQHALGFPNSDRQWVVTAYALAFGSLLLLGGRLGDMFSRKRVFITGLVGFALSSALGGAATSFEHARGCPDSSGRIRRHSRACRPGHLGQHLPRPARARPGVRRLRIRRGRRGGRGPHPRRLPDPVLLLALVPVRQPVLRRDRHGRRPGLHADQPAGQPSGDGLGRNRARLRRAVPHRLRVLACRTGRLDRRPDHRLAGRRGDPADRVRVR